MIIVCSKCGTPNEVTFIKSYKYMYESSRAYVDAQGNRSYDNVCYICRKNSRRKRLGITSRDDSKKTRVVRAVAAERAAAVFFASLGLSVKRTENHGPDLICELGGIVWTVEVKPSVKPVKNRCDWWTVAPVTTARRGDDLIAFVLPNGRIYVDSMPIHLAACNKAGSRTITKLVKQFGLP